MKTYIVDWYNKTKSGAWRNYRKMVQTDDIKSHVMDKMKLVIGCMPFGQFKGTFSSATEVCKSDKFGYDYQTVEGGEYWYSKTIKTEWDTHSEIECCTCKWNNFYDQKLKCWKIGQWKFYAYMKKFDDEN